MKGGDYLQQLKCDRDNLVEQAANLRRRIEVLNLEVGEMLTMLPSGEEEKFLNCRHNDTGFVECRAMQYNFCIGMF